MLGRQHGEAVLDGYADGLLTKLEIALDEQGAGSLTLRSPVGAELRYELPEYEAGLHLIDARFDRLQSIQRSRAILVELYC